MKKVKSENKIVIYQSPSGAIELRGDVKSETIWATQAQIADLFNVITKHIRNILKDKELNENSVCANFAQVQIEGNRRIVRNIELYKVQLILTNFIKFGIIRIYGFTAKA